MRRTLVIVTAGLLLGACADSADDDDADAEPYVEALATSMMEDEDGPPLDDTEATCFATGIVDVVGVDALREADISPDELAEADGFADLDVELPDDAAAAMADALVDCEVVDSLKGVITDSFDEEVGVTLTPDAAACLADRLEDQAVAEAFAASFVDASGEQIQALVMSSIGACPEIASLILLAELPAGLTPEAEACVRAFVEDNAEAVAEAFASGEGDSPETQRLGTQLAVACPGAFAG